MNDDRNKPAYVDPETYDKGVDAYRCPECNGIVRRYTCYCPNCGQLLDMEGVKKHTKDETRKYIQKARSKQ